jgi:predicted TIM-barrel fold metal-dependent hydrolase
MFATDYPLTNYEFYIKFIKKLKLNKKEFNKVFFENAAKLFNVKA